MTALKVATSASWRVGNRANDKDASVTESGGSTASVVESLRGVVARTRTDNSSKIALKLVKTQGHYAEKVYNSSTFTILYNFDAG